MNTSTAQSAIKIIFVPTASTELDDQGRICGSLDLPLSENGVAQAKQWAQTFAGVEVPMVYSGPTAADRQTAMAFVKAGRKKRRTKAIESWQNLNHGLWQGKILSELKENHSRFYRQWCESPDAIAPPAGETSTDVIQRVQPAFERILRKQAGRTAMIVVPEVLLGILVDLAVNAECAFDRVGKISGDDRLAVNAGLTREIKYQGPASHLV